MDDKVIENHLYSYGYDGIDNIFEYWNKHKEDIIQYLNASIPNIMSEKENLDVFEKKIRWHSKAGILFRFRIGVEARILKKSTVLNIDDVTIKFDGSALSLKRYAYKHRVSLVKINHSDMQGIPLMFAKIENLTLENIDFSHASFAYSKFTNVRFINCIFTKTSFLHCVLDNCIFDNHCLLENNDFKSSYVDSQFGCTIIDPQINKPGLFDIHSSKRIKDLRFLSFSMIRSESFIEKCNNKKICAHLMRLQARLISRN